MKKMAHPLGARGALLLLKDAVAYGSSLVALEPTCELNHGGRASGERLGEVEMEWKKNGVVRRAGATAPICQRIGGRHGQPSSADSKRGPQSRKLDGGRVHLGAQAESAESAGGLCWHGLLAAGDRERSDRMHELALCVGFPTVCVVVGGSSFHPRAPHLATRPPSPSDRTPITRGWLTLPPRMYPRSRLAVR